MSFQISAVGKALSRGAGFPLTPQHEFVPDTGALEKTRAQAEERRAAALAQRVNNIFNKRLQFVVDHESHDIIVKVIDRSTDKVIKVLPPEELQRLYDKIKETIGFFLDETV
jgi:flagellar protein FlaG